MKKILLVAVLLVAALFGYSKYQERQAVSIIEASMKDATARISTQMKYMRGGHGVSYVEFLRLVDSDLKDVSERYIEIKKSGLKAPGAVLEHGLAYLDSVQQSMRSSRRVTLALMELSTARKLAGDTIKTLEAVVVDPTNSAATTKANFTDVGYVSERIGAANIEFNSATEEFSHRFSALNSISKSRNKSLDAADYLSEKDFEPITFKVK